MRTKKNAVIELQRPGSTRGTRKSRESGSLRGGKERILVEFPSSLIQRADEAAAQLEKDTSELIRTAVERMLDGIEKEKFEQERAKGYIANSALNLGVLEELVHVDREGF